MARQYVLRKTSGIIDQQPGWKTDLINCVGGYTVSYVEDEHQDLRVEYNTLDWDVIDDTAVARASMFHDAPAGTIKIKADKEITDDDCLAGSGEDNKKVYTMTDADTANTIKFNKHLFKRIIRDRYNQNFIALNKRYAGYEGSTWATQNDEVVAYDADNSASTPFLDAYATARNISKADLVAKIKTKRDAYNTAVAALLGAQKKLEDEVDACTTMTQLFVWRHNKGLGMAHSDIIASESLDTAPTKITF